MLRPYFLYRRELLGPLCRAAYETVKELMMAAVEDIDIRPGIVAVIQTFAQTLRWNPHIHALASRGGWNARYVIRSPVSLQRLHCLPQTKQVFYQANKGHDQDDSEIVDSIEFVARVLLHVPDLNKPYIHYYGIHSNRSQRKPHKVSTSAEATKRKTRPLFPIQNCVDDGPI